MKRIVAITVAGNARSIRLLNRLGLRFEKVIRMANDDTELQLFATAG